MKRQSINLLLTVIVIGVLVIAAMFFIPRTPQNPTDKRITVGTSFYVLEHFISRIAEENVNLVSVAPVGVDAHEFEPTPQDIAKLSQADLVFFHGGGLDPWAERITGDLKQQGVTIVNINASIGATNDPHRWLDPVFAQKYVEMIREQLVASDPAHKEIFLENSDRFLTELADLDTRFKQGLSNCQLREVIVSHDAFEYLAKRYELRTMSITGVSHEEEPSPKELAELTTTAKEKGITTVFVEPLEASDSAVTLAQEIGGTTLALNPIEGLTSEELAAGKDYVQLMNENLTNLRSGMKCQ
jgi:zinc transport system substrate-binding protein